MTRTFAKKNYMKRWEIWRTLFQSPNCSPKLFFTIFVSAGKLCRCRVEAFPIIFHFDPTLPFRTEPKPKQTRRCRTNKHFDVAETGAENKQDTFPQNVDDHQPSHNHTDRVKLVESLLELGILKLHHRGHDDGPGVDRQLLDQLQATTGGAPPPVSARPHTWPEVPARVKRLSAELLPFFYRRLRI